MTTERSWIVTREGVTHEYVLRALRDENEVADWAACCASVFQHKDSPPDAAYFRRHFFGDPRRDASLVRVAVVPQHSEGGGEQQSRRIIVASCRVFCRRIAVGTCAGGGAAWVEAGGIGEVCTASEHQRRGLSKELLHGCLQSMGSEVPLSLLHAAPAFFPVYQSAGYECVLSEWSNVTLGLSKLVQAQSQLSADITCHTDASSSLAVRLAQFPDDTEQLLPLHQSYSEERFVGCIIRSAEYWNEYLSEELKGSLWILESKDDGMIQGWLSIRPRGEKYQLREFGCRSVELVPAVFPRLLHEAATVELAVTRTRIQLLLPTKIFHELGADTAAYVAAVVAENDYGWMYKKRVTDTVSMPEIALLKPHLIWPSDSF